MVDALTDALQSSGVLDEKPHPGLAPRDLVNRVDGDLLFAVVVLRLDKKGLADVVYLDEGNVEIAVPLEELQALTLQEEEQYAAEDIGALFEAGLARLQRGGAGAA